jgi:hypothetical protein
MGFQLVPWQPLLGKQFGKHIPHISSAIRESSGMEIVRLWAAANIVSLMAKREPDRWQILKAKPLRGALTHLT